MFESTVFESEWYKTRPEIIQKLVRQFPPECTVRLKETGQIAQIYSYFENETLSVIIDAYRSFVLSGWTSFFGIEENYRVFGLKPDQLERM